MTALQILLVGEGSALGGMARFMLSQVLRTGGRFPWATLAVNVAGSLTFGNFAGWFAKAGMTDILVESAALHADEIGNLQLILDTVYPYIV